MQGSPAANGSGYFAACLAAIRRRYAARKAGRAVEAAAQEAEKRFASFMQHLPGLAWIKDFDGRYVFANDAALAAFRKSRAELYGRTDVEVFPPETAAQFQANDQRALAEEKGLHTTETLRHDDGILHQSIVSKFPIPGRDGKPALIGGIAIDITDRRRAEAQFLESEARKAAMLDMALDCIITIDHAGHIVDFNPAAERTFGYRRDEALGREMCELIIPPALRASHRAGFTRHLVTGESRILGRRLELTAVRADGSEFPVELAITRIPGEEPLFTGFLRDITDRKLSEQTLRDADRRKDEFLATLAHELRNPLAPVRSAVELLRFRGSGEPELHWARDVIDRQVEHLTRLIDDLLDVSRITRNNLELRKERVALEDIIRGAVETSRPLIEQHGHQLILSLPEAPVYLSADLVRLAQVFMNLLSNAAKYTERGGRIWLTAERVGGDVVVQVRDSGVGVPADKLPQLFELFYQVDSSMERTKGGLGIGLSLARRLVELHGGTIEARSDGVGKGSEFVVRLAVAAGAEAAPPKRRAADTRAHARIARRILVADDNRDAADSLAELLRLDGNDVRIAYDSLEALRVADAFRPDAALLDIGMPHVNGCEAARTLRAQPWGKTMVLIAVTGWGQREDRHRTAEAGFDAHMVKPVDYDALVEVLAELPARAEPASQTN